MTTVRAGRQRSFDGLRGWAAVVVLIHHLLLMSTWYSEAQASTTGVAGGDWLHRAVFFSPLHIVAAGTEAVAVFFVLSGAVLATAFPGRESLRASYFTSRLTRLYLPIVGAVLFALFLTSTRPEVPASAVSAWHAEHLAALQWPAVVAHPQLLLNEMFVLRGTSWLDAPLWSMRVEIAVSIGFFIVWLAARAGLFGLAVSVVMAVVFRHSDFSWLTANIPFFVAGVILVRLKWRPDYRQANLLFALGVLWFTMPWMARGLGVDLAYGLLGNAWMIAGAASMCMAALSTSALTPALEGRVGGYLGTRSYSLYLIHGPLITTLGFWLASWGGGEPNWWVWRIPVAIAAFVTAEVFYRVVEGPAHRLSQQLRKRVAEREAGGALMGECVNAGAARAVAMTNLRERPSRARRHRVLGSATRNSESCPRSGGLVEPAATPDAATPPRRSSGRILSCRGASDTVGAAPKVQHRANMTDDTAPDSGDEMTSQRILIIGINYAPEHSGIAPYTTQAAEHLVSLGHQVEVMTGVPHYPSWTVPSAYRLKPFSEEDLNGVTVRRLRHFVPASQSALRRGLYEATFALHVLCRAPKARPDVVVAVVPSLMSAVPAARIAQRADARFVMWIQDSMASAASQSGIAGGGAVSDLVGAIERSALRRAHEVMVISDAFRQHVVDAGVASERVHLVPNWTHIALPTAPRVEMRKRLGWRDDEVIALHAGNMGLKQGLENLVNAARLAESQGRAIRFVLLGDGSQRRRLEQLAIGARHLEFMDPVLDEVFADVLAAADVLLVNEAHGVRDMSLPSKLTSYRVTGLPVVAAVDDAGATAMTVRGLGGVVIAPGKASELVEACVGAWRIPRRPLASAACVPEELCTLIVGS